MQSVVRILKVGMCIAVHLRLISKRTLPTTLRDLNHHGRGTGYLEVTLSPSPVKQITNEQDEQPAMPSLSMLPNACTHAHPMPTQGPRCVKMQCMKEVVLTLPLT